MVPWPPAKQDIKLIIIFIGVILRSRLKNPVALPIAVMVCSENAYLNPCNNLLASCCFIRSDPFPIREVLQILSLTMLKRLPLDQLLNIRAE